MTAGEAHAIVFGTADTHAVLTATDPVPLPGAAARVGSAFDARQLGAIALGDLTTRERPTLRVELIDKAGQTRVMTPPLELARPLLATGMRLVIEHLDRTSAELGALARELAALLGSSVVPSAWLAPDGAVTPAAREPAAAFVFQISGDSSWRVDGGAPRTLAAGDGLFVPDLARSSQQARGTSCQLVLATQRR